MTSETDNRQTDSSQDETGFVEGHMLFALPGTLAHPIQTQTPIEKRFKAADLFQFQRGRGDYTLSLFLLLLVGIFIWYFPSETGWAKRKLPDDIWQYFATQFGLTEAEGRVMRFGKIVKQGWVAPLFCLALLVPAVLINLVLSHRALKRKQRQLAPLRWGYEMNEWLRAVEYILYFIAYTFMVPFLGYLASTLMMGCFLTWRVGYRSWRWMGIALLSSFAMVVLFRSVLQIKTPVNIWLYNQMPEGASIFFKTWF